MEGMYGHRTAAIYGYSHLTGGVPGGQADFVRVPFADVNCLVLPDDVPDDKALYLSDVVPTAYHGTELANVKAGSTVAICMSPAHTFPDYLLTSEIGGLGPIGLMTARWCQIKKAARIIGIDWVPERLAVARNYLNIETINFKEQDTCKTLAKMVPGIKIK